MKIATKVLLVFAAIAIAVGMSACGERGASKATGSQATAAPAGLLNIEGAQPKVMRDPKVGEDLYVFVLCWTNLEFFAPHIKAFTEEGKILGVQTRVMGPAGFDVPAEISAMQSAIALHPAGIIIFPPSDALGPVINKAIEAGIPVVTVTGDVPSSKRTTFVGVDQHEVGIVGGEYLAKYLNGQGNIAALTITTQMFQDRLQGYIDTFKTHPGMKIIAEGDTKGDFSTGIAVAKSILEAHPDLNAFICVDSVGAKSAVTAIREAGKTGKVVVMGMDRNNDTVTDVGNGQILASVAQMDAMTTYYGLQVLYNLKHNPVPITTDNVAAGVVGAPTWIDTGVGLVTKENWKYWITQ